MSDPVPSSLLGQDGVQHHPTKISSWPPCVLQGAVAPSPDAAPVLCCISGGTWLQTQVPPGVTLCRFGVKAPAVVPGGLGSPLCRSWEPRVCFKESQMSP